MGELLELIYVSSASRLLDDKELLEILESSRENNARDEIGGMLVYHEGSFLQVLEGPEPAVESAFARIATDDRHSNLIRLRKRNLEERAFPEWSMGFAQPSRQDLLAIPGCNDFFAQGHCLTEVNEGQAKTLLAGFKKRAR